MLVYRYLNSSRALQAIQKKRLRISIINELNDPYELLCANFSDKNMLEAMIKTKNSISEKRGIICFSETWDNHLLWSHYGDKYKGICLGIELPKTNLSKIDYITEKIEVQGDVDEILMKKFLTSKFKIWDYENEYRAFFSLDESSNESFFIDFSDQIILKEVIIGPLSKTDHTDIINALQNTTENTKVFKIDLSEVNFQIKRTVV